MGDKEVKNKKGFMSRLSSFRKKKSSSKHGSSAKHGNAGSLKNSSVENSSDGSKNMLSDVDRKSRASSYVSSSQNSLEGLNGRTRSTSDLIAGYEKRVSLFKDGSGKTVAQPPKRSSKTDSTSSQESERSLRATADKPVSQVKGHIKTTAQSATTHNSSIKPYRSVFNDVTKNEHVKVLNALEKADDTTQTDFSQPSQVDDEAKLVKVQSTKTPETKRAHLSAAKHTTYVSGKGDGSNYKPLKETFIGPDSITPGKVVDNSRLRFQSTSTPITKSPNVIVELSSSPIRIGTDDSVSRYISHTDGIGQLEGIQEMPISHVQAHGDGTRTKRNISSFSTQNLESKRVEEEVWTKQQLKLESKMPGNALDDNKGRNTTFTKSHLPQITSIPPGQTVEQSITTSGNSTIVLESGSKDLVGQTFSLESTGADSLCSDDLMCDSKFMGLTETTFLTSETINIESHQPVKDDDKNKPGYQRRKGSDGNSISSSYSPSSILASSSSVRARLNSTENASCMMIETVVYNSMVKEISSMRLMLRKLSTLLHEEKVVKTRSSEVQLDPMWNRRSQDTQTEVSELMDASAVSVASVQCNIHPEKRTCGSQYEKPRELPKPSRLAAPASKLTKPRTTQPSSKENGSTARSSQVTNCDQSERPAEEERDAAKEGEDEVGDEEKRDDMKASEEAQEFNRGSDFSSVEIKVKDTPSSELIKTSPAINIKSEMTKEMSEDPPQTPVNGVNVDDTKGYEGVNPPLKGSMEIIGEDDNKRSLSGEGVRSSETVSLTKMGDDRMDVDEAENGYLRNKSKLDKVDNNLTTTVEEDKEKLNIGGIEKSCKSDEHKLKTQEEKSEISGHENGIQKLMTSGSPSKVSKLQQYKSTNLRYSQPVKTDKGSSGRGRAARPQSGLRPPQWSKPETVSKIEYQSSLKNNVKQSELCKTDGKSTKSNSENQLAPVQKYPANENMALSSSKKAETASATVNEDPQGGFYGNKPAVVTQASSKLQRLQRVSQSKLTPPSNYSNAMQKKMIEKAQEGALSDSSDGKSVDDNANSSTGGSRENISGDMRSIPTVSKTSSSRLPKVKSTSRLPRGRGIPRMNPR